MKKIIFTLIIVFSLVTGVKAENTSTCYDDYLTNLTWQSGLKRYDVTKDKWIEQSYSNGYMTLTILFELKPDTIYYFKNLNNTYNWDTFPIKYVNYYDQNKNFISKIDLLYGTIDLDNNQIYFSIPSDKIPSNSVYVSFVMFQKTYDYLNPSPVVFSDFDLSSCPITEPEIIPDTTLDNFYNIYTSKVKEISQYAQENKFILSAIGIVLLIVTINLFLYLFNKGGYR